MVSVHHALFRTKEPSRDLTGDELRYHQRRVWLARAPAAVRAQFYLDYPEARLPYTPPGGDANISTEPVVMDDFSSTNPGAVVRTFPVPPPLVLPEVGVAASVEYVFPRPIPHSRVPRWSRFRASTSAATSVGQPAGEESSDDELDAEMCNDFGVPEGEDDALIDAFRERLEEAAAYISDLPPLSRSTTPLLDETPDDWLVTEEELQFDPPLPREDTPPPIPPYPFPCGGGGRGLDAF